MEPISPAPASAFLSVAWEPVEDPPDTSATAFDVRFALPDGARLARVDARETGSQVFVTVLAQRDEASVGEGSPADAAAEDTATVALAAPLGDRALVHAPHDHPPR